MNIEEGRNLIKHTQKVFGSDSLSNCLQCGVLNAIVELEKLLPRIDYASNLDYGHLSHCPQAIREWFDMTSETQQPIVLKKILEYINANQESLESNRERIGDMCALEFVNTVYREVNEALPETNAANMDARSFWGVLEGCQPKFVKVPSIKEFGSDEAAANTRRNMGFIDWVHDMRDLLKHTSVFSRLNELTKKEDKTSREKAEYGKLEKGLLETRSKLSIRTNINILKLLGTTEDKDRFFNFKQLKFEDKASNVTSTEEIFSTARLWAWIQRVFDIAIVDDKNKPGTIQELLNFKFECYKLKPMSYINVKEFSGIEK